MEKTAAPNRKLVIGLMGMQGSGKGAFSNALMRFAASGGRGSVEVFSSGELLAEILAVVGVTKTRAHMQNLAVKLRKIFGDVITEAMRKKIVASNADVVIFDGVRWESDMVMIREFPFYLSVYISAERAIRYERMKLRKEKVGEDVISERQFLDEDSAETEIEIPVIGEAAHVKILNEGTFRSFENQVAGVYQHIKRGGFFG